MTNAIVPLRHAAHIALFLCSARVSAFGADATMYDANQRQVAKFTVYRRSNASISRLVKCEREHDDDDGGGGGHVVFLRHAITEQHVTGEYGLTVDTLFGDDGVAAADDDKRARLVPR